MLSFDIRIEITSKSLLITTLFFNRPAVQVDTIPGSSFFGVPVGHVKQNVGEFNITAESQMEFEFRTFHKTAFVASVLNGQVCRLSCIIQSYLCNRIDISMSMIVFFPVTVKSHAILFAII